MSSDQTPENALAHIPVVESSLPQYTQKDYDAVTSSGNYLNRIQLCGSSSKLTKQSIVGMGVYAYVISADKAEDLGNKVPVVVLARRIKALRMVSKKVEAVSFDPSTAIFKEIEAQGQKGALPKDSPTVAMYGPEFLLYIPSARGGEGVCATYHLSNPTGRKQGGEFSNYVGKPATLGVRFIDPPGSTFSWHGPTIGPCSKAIVLPTDGSIEKAMRLFLNPPKDQRVLVEAEGKGAEAIER